MALVITIGGVTKTIKAGSLNIASTASGRTTASFSVVSSDASYRPALDAEVIITQDGTRVFGGLVDRPSEKGLIEGAHAGIVTQISTYDFNQYAERRCVLEGGGFPAGYTLKQCLTSLLGYLSVYGVTLDAGQVDGPTFPEIICEFQQVSEIFNNLMTLTAKYGDPYVWRIDAFKVLRAFQPADLAAPFDITTANGRAVGDVTVEISREKYANRVVLKVPPKQEVNRVESFTADGVTDTFTLQYTPTKLYGHVLIDSGGGETLTTTEFAGTTQWELDTAANTVTRVAGPPTVGTVISVPFDGTFSASATAEDAGEIATYGPWERIVTVESVPSDTTAQAIVDGYLAQFLPTPKTIKYRTRGTGLAPGQVQTITLPARNLSVSALITDVVTRDSQNQLFSDVTAVTGATHQGGWRDVYKVWSGDKLGKAAPIVNQPSVGTGAIVGVTAGPPNRAVQFNRNGSFGGDASFIWYEDENSVVCGDGGSSITAAAFESCQVFGYNNHITDP
jgi:hypothetical protein